MHPESKALAILCLILAISLDPAMPLWRTGLYLIYLGWLVALFGVSPVQAILRSLFFLPFLLFIVVFGILPSASLQQALLLIQKVFLSALGLAVLGLANDFPDLVKGLHRLGMPGVMAMLLSFMYRYLELLLAEAKRMEAARNQRYFGGRYFFQLKVLGNMIGSLFLRTYERGERIYQAMVLRGYSGMPKREAVTYAAMDITMVLSGISLLLIVLGSEMLWHF